jgi:hypothetical protein
MKTKVLIIESERGWGSKVEDTKEFDTHEEAVAFCDNFNKDNTETTVPDWYMYARIA